MTSSEPAPTEVGQPSPPAPQVAHPFTRLLAQVDSRILGAVRGHPSGFSLTLSEKAYLLRACRVALEAYFRGRRPRVDEFSLVPPRLLSQQAKIFVTLLTGGSIRGCRSAGQGSLLQCGLEATRRSIRDLRFGGKLGRSEVVNTRIDIVILLGPEPISGRDTKSIRREVEIGVHSISVSRDGKRAFFKSNVPVTKGFDLPTTLRRLCRKAGLGGRAWREQETEISRYNSVHFREVFHGRFARPQVQELYRNRPIVLQADVDRGAIERAIRLSGEFLRAHITPKGRMTYTYDPKTGEKTYSNVPVAVLRKLAATWILAEIGRWSHDRRFSRAASRTLSRVLERHFVDDPESGFGYLKVKKTANLGLSGFALLVLSALDDSGFRPDARAGLTRLVLAMEDREGGYLVPTLLPKRTDGTSDKQIYYSGQALTALLFEQQRGQIGSATGVAGRVLPFYEALFDHHPKRMNMAAWMSKAYAKAFELTGDERFARFVFRMNDHVASKQRGLDVLWPDRIGSFTDEGRSYTTGVFLESIAEGLAVARTVGDEERARTYGDRLYLGVRYLLQCQYTPQDVPESGRAGMLGGFQTTLFDTSVRIDNVQHCGCALLRAVDLLDLPY